MRIWQDYVLRKNYLVQSFALSPTKVKEHITFGHSLQKYICNLRTDNRYTDIVLTHSFCIGNRMVSSGIWNKFFGTNKIARAPRASAICDL